MDIVRFLRRKLARPFVRDGKKYQARRDWEGALECYNKAARILGHSPGLSFSIGNILAELGMFDAAQESYAKASQDPQFLTRIMVAQAGMEERRGQWSAAIDAWERVLQDMASMEQSGRKQEWAMTPAKVLLHLAKCRQANGADLESERDFNLALVLDPSSRLDHEAVLMRSRLLAKTSKQASYSLLERGRRKFPADQGIALALIQCALDVGRREDASRLGREWLASAPGDALALRLLEVNGLAPSPAPES